ncbi:MAG: pantoate--beta-alanine ligase, partial [Bacteroidales bacterium]|nr:pantoate--beta-alanine ligase [Bacteroidales bacterium]
LKNKIISEINAEDNFNVEYFDIVDDRELIPVHSHEDIDPGKSYTGCIAVYAGEVRLIDNIPFSFRFPKG